MTDPKVKYGSLTGLVVGLVVAVVLDAVPSLRAHSDLVQALVVAGVTAGTAYLVGWYKRAHGWATRYVQKHEAVSFPSSDIH